MAVGACQLAAGSITNATIRDTSIVSGATGATWSGATMNFSRVTISAPRGAIEVLGTKSSTIENSVIRNTPGGSPADAAIAAGNGANVLVNPNGSGSGDGTLTQGAGTITNVAPGFVNAPFLNYRLSAPSPLIDAGDPADAFTLDHTGNPRQVEGDGAGGARSDLGAYEYQYQAPTALLSGPDTVVLGEAAGFSSTGSADPDLEALTPDVELRRWRHRAGRDGLACLLGPRHVHGDADGHRSGRSHRHRDQASRGARPARASGRGRWRRHRHEHRDRRERHADPGHPAAEAQRAAGPARARAPGAKRPDRVPLDQGVAGAPALRALRRQAGQALPALRQGGDRRPSTPSPAATACVSPDACPSAARSSRAATG